MSDDELQKWLDFNRSRGRDSGCGWRGIGGMVVVKKGMISQIRE
jgi:hypothetical protein